MPAPDKAAPARRDLVVAALAAAGLVLSAYLAGTRLLGGTPAFCEAGGGCDIVQASRYGTFLGLPTALWGVGYYAAVLWLAARPIDVRRWRRLFVLTAAGLAFSLYLTWLEVAVIRALCGWCLLSALLTVALFAAVWMRRPAVAPRGPTLPDRAALVRTAAATGAVVIVGAWLLFDVEIGRPATAFQEGLARHLAAQGAVMYGAYWCPACNEQKGRFGPAAKLLPYVECDPRGAGARPETCARADVRRYPTWIIGGRRIEGVLGLGELADLSGYAGPRR